MISYQSTIRTILRALSTEDKEELSILVAYYGRQIEDDETPIIFIKEDKEHVLCRLALMILGLDFAVIPTTMSNAEITSSFTDFSKGVIITDNIENVESKSLLFRTLDFYPDNYNIKSEIFDEEEYPNWTMILYDTKRNQVMINNTLFSLLYANLEMNFQKYGMHYQRECSILAESEDFFLYYLVSRSQSKIPFIVNEYDKEQLLLISYNNYKAIWKETLSLTLQNKIFFKLFFNKIIGRIIMLLVVRRFLKRFKLFKRIVVLGLITDPILAEVSEKLRSKKVFNTYGETSSLMATGMSQKPGHISIIPGLSTASISLKESSKNFRILSKDNDVNTFDRVSNVMLSFRTNNLLLNVISDSLFIINGDYAKFLGHAFTNGVCPIHIESIFNSFPFIKDSALVLWKGNYHLLLDVDEAMLEANNINYMFFNKIMKGQVDKMNELVLPKAIQIKTFGQVPCSVPNYNRLGLLNKDFLYNVEFIV